MQERYRAIGASPVTHCEDDEGIETSLIQGDAERAGTLQPREEEVSKNLMGKEERARLLSVVSSGRTRGNYHKLKRKKLYLNTGKYIFTVKVVAERNRHPDIAQRCCRVSNPGNVQNLNGHGHEQLHEQGLD